MKILKIKGVTSYGLAIDGKTIECVNIAGFALLIGKTRTFVHMLIKDGSKGRKLHTYKILGKTFIPLSEYTNFPFNTSGPIDRFYSYDESGRVVWK